MAKISFPGLDEYLHKIEKLYAISDGMLKQAVYKGSGVVADAVRREIESLPELHPVRAKEGEMPEGLTKKEREGLLEGLGVSTMITEKGFINVKLGFNGYNNDKTKSWPNGKPNAMIARSIESGTSFRKKTRFVENAVKKAREAAENEMKNAIDAAIAAEEV